MSWTQDRKLVPVKYEEVDTTVPDLGIHPLPGRIVTVSHKQVHGLIAIPDKERYWCDVVVVVESGVRGIEKGDVWLVASGHGAFLPNKDREVRLFGVVSPWYESFVAKLSPDGIAPGPGWTMIDPEVKTSSLALPESYLKKNQQKLGTIVADNSDMGTNAGDRIEYSHYRPWKVGRYDFIFYNASKGWLRRLGSQSSQRQD